jgi:hypothetical protein
MTDNIYIKSDPNESTYAFMYRLKMKLNEERYEKRKIILEFLNKWIFGLTKNRYYKYLGEFKNIFYRDMPNDNISKDYLKEHFEKYNDLFDLELDYNEDLFTTYNVLYFIKLMLMKVDGNMKKEIIEIKNKKNKLVKRKRYTIFLKK